MKNLKFETMFNNMSQDDKETWGIKEINEIKGMVGEAAACKSLEFFGIVENENGLEIPDDFNVDEAQNVIDGYLAIIEDDESDNIMSYKYNEYTKPHRGADDGTYDYAGSYVDMILQIIKQNQ